MERILAAIDAECGAIEASYQAAQDEATNEESKPEGKYDTRALEASYLAGAQQERLNELRGVRQYLAALPLKTFNANDPVAATALVELNSDGNRSLCFLLMFGAGYIIDLPDGRRVKTVTIKSPLGLAISGKVQGDYAVVAVAGRETEYEITGIW
jgi:hypothetical protein